MKRNVELPELVDALKEENLQKRDVVIPSTQLHMEGGVLEAYGEEYKPNFNFQLPSHHEVLQTPLDLTETAHTHIEQKLGIPKKYYERMRSDNVELLDENVNSWLQMADKNYFLRCFMDSSNNLSVCRALLSDRFKVIDNYDVLFAALDAIKESNIPVEVKSCDITEKKMYVQFICPEFNITHKELLERYKNPETGDVSDKIITGFILSNSEVGCGQFSISPRAIVGACSNGLIFHDDSFKRTHLGQKMEENSSIQWSERTKEVNYELIMSQVKDAINTYASEDYIGGKMDEIARKAGVELEYPLDAVKNVCSNINLSQEKEADILNYFVKSGDTTGFGITQAITFCAQKCESADEQFDLEVAGMNLIDNLAEYDKPRS